MIPKKSKQFCLALVLILSIISLAQPCRGGEDAAEPGIIMAAMCPDDVVFLGSLDQPGKMLTLFLPVLPFVQMAAGDEMGKALDAAKAFVAAHTDVNLFDPASYARAGIDMSQPVTFAVMPTKGSKKLMRLVVSVGVSDAAKAVQTAENLFQGGGFEAVVDREKAITVYRFQDPSRRLYMAVKSSRMYLSVSEGLDYMPVHLRDFLQRASTAALKETSAFKSTITALKPRPGFSVYFNLMSVADEPDASKDWFLRNFQVLAMNSSFDNQLSFLLTFQDEAPLERLLAPGGTCKSFLARFDKPLAALTVSLKDPMALIKYLVRENAGPKAWDNSIALLNQQTGIDLSALKQFCKGETLGIAVYPSKQARPNLPFDLTLFSKVVEAGKMTAALEKINVLHKTGDIQGQPLFTSPPVPLPLGMTLVDDYLVVGTEIDRIKQVAEVGKPTAPWEPYCGKHQLLSGEIYARDMAAKFAQQIPQAGLFGAMLPDQPFLLDVSKLHQGVKLSIAGAHKAPMLFALQAGVLAGFLVPTVMSGRARMRRVRCVYRQSNLARLLLLYSDEHGDRFPDKLSDLYHAMPEARDLSLYACPERGTVLKGPEEIDTKSDFHYVKGLNPMGSFRKIILYDKKPHADGKVNITYVDASVKLMTPAELKAALQKQKEQ